MGEGGILVLWEDSAIKSIWPLISWSFPSTNGDVFIHYYEKDMSTYNIIHQLLQVHTIGNDFDF